jgi:hypothetical protein
MFADKDGAFPSGAPLRKSTVRVGFPKSISLGWKSQRVTNTLTYYGTGFITAVKSFIKQAPAYNQN